MIWLLGGWENGRLEDRPDAGGSGFCHTWNTLGALIRSLKEKKLDGTWDRSYKAAREAEELYDV